MAKWEIAISWSLIAANLWLVWRNMSQSQKLKKWETDLLEAAKINEGHAKLNLQTAKMNAAMQGTLHMITVSRLNEKGNNEG